ncbi:hypothetical protein HC251_15640 [Iamia sp. SCSIO 61187]|uniref:hypothetical protein n=1 Tax=Iamia sp. SCSIO 61187 TaxID=2722752 RepID=UPI001C629AA7|nr:hypothetical protein [Iamia sp. SCSIO 61187]QYG93715.1 hypothetical protein HC251_15640 [Iamia sp. SCSIO 61187]
MPDAVPPPAAADGGAPGARADVAIAAALAAIDGGPVDDSRPARRAATVIRAIQAHRPTGPSAAEHGQGDRV